ncbi:hypothetical protein [Pseudomonas sp. URMO17WK12:I11]|uniref:hypothetical protein n=1 Tax=Pseudomonas sp. URMO17WK12:I11 TaxID=1283291 RepID=UPI0012E3BEAA|nr:hypothetical protein [Pseudomonas sp. URMO17WK12:I11]
MIEDEIEALFNQVSGSRIRHDVRVSEDSEERAEEVYQLSPGKRGKDSYTKGSGASPNFTSASEAGSGLRKTFLASESMRAARPEFSDLASIELTPEDARKRPTFLAPRIVRSLFLAGRSETADLLRSMLEILHCPAQASAMFVQLRASARMKPPSYAAGVESLIGEVESMTVHQEDAEGIKE